MANHCEPNSKLQLCCWVQNLIVDVPNFAENASFLSLLKLSQTNKEMHERLLPILKTKRLQDLKNLQTWLSTWSSVYMNQNYTLIKLINLEQLHLSSNQITEIPPEIGQLTNLNALDLSVNQITEISPVIGQLTNLKVLNLYWNQITEIPPEIGLLTNLKTLNLAYNRIKEIPPEFGQLTHLESLELSKNQITEIPPDLFFKVAPVGSNSAGKEIEHSCNLKFLWLNDNKIVNIPPYLKRPGLMVFIKAFRR